MTAISLTTTFSGNTASTANNDVDGPFTTF
jgi:hypothetical protein